MARQINPAGLALIKEFEGCKLTPYKCPAGVWTVGFGSTGPHVTPGKTITMAEAEALLRKDLERFERGVEGVLGDSHATDNQFAAMVSLAFNIGLGSVGRGIPGFYTSTVLRKHKAGDTKGAAEAFLMWNKAGGKVLAGLTRRRKAEKKLYES